MNDSVVLFYSLFCGNDETRGKLHFEGNLLFTHYGEIDAPDRLAMPDQRHGNINT